MRIRMKMRGEGMSTAPDVLRSFAICHSQEDVFLNQDTVDEFTSEMHMQTRLSTHTKLYKMTGHVT